MKDKREIPEFQYEGLGRAIVALLRRRTHEWPVELKIELLDFKRTIVITDGQHTTEITMRYPVIP